MFELKLKTGGSAFRDPYTGEEDEWYEAREIARIMDKVRDDLLAGLDHGGDDGFERKQSRRME